MGWRKSGEMQLGEAERIEVAFQEDAGARLAAAAWFEKNTVAPWEYRLAKVISGIAHALLAGAASAGLALAFGLNFRFTTSLAVFIAVLAWYGWGRWVSSYQQRVFGAFDTEAWGEVRYVFTPLGVELVDDQRQWRIGWRGVALIAAEAEGLFLASKGIVFYLPNRCWTDPAAMRADAGPIEAWWRASGVPL